jgi:Cdc6-like AAA superfamily ATPase
MTEEQKNKLLYRLLPRAFNPAGPISEKDMFMGRSKQIDNAMEAILQPNQHLVIIGERGVGKTSLANVIYDIMKELETSIGFIYAKVNCGRSESFTSLWKSILRSVRFTKTTRKAGLGVDDSASTKEISTLADTIPEDRVTPSRIVELVGNRPGVWIFDEFNTLTRREAQPFADLLKALSDSSSKSKLILVGVAESLATLIEDHASVERSIRQVIMPRMNVKELGQIITGAEKKTGLVFSPKVQQVIVKLSQGLPYFVHQLGLCSGKAAVNGDRTTVDRTQLLAGIADAIDSSEQSLQEAYRLAIHSQKPQALYREVLLACALARTDAFGYFQQSAVIGPLSRIRNRAVVPGMYAAHLTAFCAPERGPVLVRRGARRNYVYRFMNPLLQPYAIMHGIKEGHVQSDWLDSLVGIE